MIAKEDILSLKAKILPAGADQILDFLAGRHKQVELTHIVLENVPLLIIGRHGMIARIPINGVLQKVSQPAGILELMQTFFEKKDTLYLFINLPELPVPAEVKQVLQEVQARAARKEELHQMIDQALDNRDSALFYEASNEWRKLHLTDT